MHLSLCYQFIMYCTSHRPEYNHIRLWFTIDGNIILGQWTGDNIAFFLNGLWKLTNSLFKGTSSSRVKLASCMLRHVFSNWSFISGMVLSSFYSLDLLKIFSKSTTFVVPKCNCSRSFVSGSVVGSCCEKISLLSIELHNIRIF